MAAQRMEMMTMYLTQDQARRLKALSARTRIPYSAMVRDAVDAWLPAAEQRAEGPLVQFLRRLGGGA